MTHISHMIRVVVSYDDSGNLRRLPGAAARSASTRDSSSSRSARSERVNFRDSATTSGWPSLIRQRPSPQPSTKMLIATPPLGPIQARRLAGSVTRSRPACRARGCRRCRGAAPAPARGVDDPGLPERRRAASPCGILVPYQVVHPREHRTEPGDARPRRHVGGRRGTERPQVTTDDIGYVGFAQRPAQPAVHPVVDHSRRRPATVRAAEAGRAGSRPLPADPACGGSNPREVLGQCGTELPHGQRSCSQYRVHGGPHLGSGQVHRFANVLAALAFAVLAGLGELPQGQRVVGREQVDGPPHHHQPDQLTVARARRLTSLPGRSRVAGRAATGTAAASPVPAARPGG